MILEFSCFNRNLTRRNRKTFNIWNLHNFHPVSKGRITKQRWRNILKIQKNFHIRRIRSRSRNREIICSTKSRQSVFRVNEKISFGKREISFEKPVENSGLYVRLQSKLPTVENPAIPAIKNDRRTCMQNRDKWQQKYFKQVARRWVRAIELRGPCLLQLRLVTRGHVIWSSDRW